MVEEIIDIKNYECIGSDDLECKDNFYPNSDDIFGAISEAKRHSRQNSHTAKLVIEWRLIFGDTSNKETVDEKPTRLTLADLDHSYTGKGLILKESDAIELRDRVVKAHTEDFDGFEDVIETIATKIAEDEENVSEEAWKGALRFKQELQEVFSLE